MMRALTDKGHQQFLLLFHEETMGGYMETFEAMDNVFNISTIHFEKEKKLRSPCQFEYSKNRRDLSWPCSTQSRSMPRINSKFTVEL